MIQSALLVCAGLMLLLSVSVFALARMELVRPQPLTSLAICTVAAYWLRVATYLPLFSLVPVQELYHEGLLLGGLAFGFILLTGYIFILMAILNLVFPRTLRAVDIFILSVTGSTAATLVLMAYSVGKVMLNSFLA